MKIIFLLLAGLLSGSNGFAGKKDPSPGAAVGQNPEETRSWPDRLQSSTWRERQKAVMDWKTALNLLEPREILTHLIPRLSDNSRKVQETIPKVFTDLVESYPSLATEIIETVMEKVKGPRPERFSLIETAGKKGLSHSNYQVRLKTIALLTETGTKYPSVYSNIALLLEARQKKERTHHVKVALKKALKTLETGACKELWRPGGRPSGPMG